MHDASPTSDPPATRALGVRNQSRINSVAIRLGDDPPSTVWRKLATSPPLQHALINAVEQHFDAANPGVRGRKLRSLGVTAAGGLYAAALTRLADPDVDAHALVENDDEDRLDVGDAARDPRHDDNKRELARDALAITAAWGSGTRTSIGHLSLDSLKAGPLAAMAAGAFDDPLAVDVHLTRDWFDARADHRRQTLDLLVDVADVLDVDLVASTLNQHRLAAQHQADLPASVYEQCSTTRGRGGAAPYARRDIDELVAVADQRLDPDEAPAEMLRALASERSQRLSYTGLTEAVQRSRATIRNHVRTLSDLSLVRSPDGATWAELTTVGAAYVDRVSRQARLTEPTPDSVFSPPKDSDESRGTRASTEGGTDGSPSPPAEAAEAATTSNRHRCPTDPANVEFLNRARGAVYRRISPGQGIAVHDYPVDQRENVKHAGWGFEDDHLVVEAEAVNPMQYATSIARALSSPKTWSNILTRQRVDVDGPLTGLAVSDPDLITDLTNVGWLDSRDLDGRDDLKAAMLAARDDLEELTMRLRHGQFESDEAAFRGKILRTALGLIGSMQMLLWLAGVEVTVAATLPNTARDYDDDRLDDFAGHFAKLVSITTQYGGQTLERLVYENRQSKLDRAIWPASYQRDVLGSAVGNLVVLGDDVEDRLSDRLQERVASPDEPRDDPSPWAVAADIPVRRDVPREQYVDVLRWALRDAGGLRPSREAVDVLRALLPSPFDAVDALWPLSAEAEARGLRLDEVRYAVATALREDAIDASRLLPEATPVQRSLVRTLLAADRPLTQGELVDRAEISAQSFRNHRDALIGIGLLAIVDGKYRLTLPFDAGEAKAVHGRDPDPDPDLVGVAVPAPTVDDVATLSSVLADIVDRLDAVSSVSSGTAPWTALSWPPDYDAVVDAWPWLESWIDVLHRLVSGPDPGDTPVRVGVYDPQKRLTEYGRQDTTGKLGILADGGGPSPRPPS